MTVSRVLREKPLLDTRREYGHLHYFTKSTFLTILEEAGYRVLHWEYTPISLAPELMGKTLKTRFANFFRRFTFCILPNFTVRVMGGYSLLVVAK
jgi:hypothetical protein